MRVRLRRQERVQRREGQRDSVLLVLQIFQLRTEIAGSAGAGYTDERTSFAEHAKSQVMSAESASFLMSLSARGAMSFSEV